MNEPWPIGGIVRAGTGSRVHQSIVETGQLDLVHVQADELRVKGRKMIAWMGLCAVSVHMKFLRNAGEGESKTSRTPARPGGESQTGQEHVGKCAQRGV